MENERMQISLAPGCEKAEIIIREVSSVNELPVKAPLKINLDGTLDAVNEFLVKRMLNAGQITPERCHIIVDREKISMQLIFNENDDYLRGSVRGSLALHPKFKEFGINTGKVWTPTELGLFFKMNRAFFPDKSANMSLVTDLMHFTGTVNNKIEKLVKESGDRTDNFSQVVNSNLPKTFTLVIPIFKGMPPESLEIETFAQINGREVSFVLLSPSANQLMEDLRDSVIDSELNAIRNTFHSIAIIEV
jgi:hypothetical protein